MTYAVVHEHGPDEEGRESWSAWVPDLAGCASGRNAAECEAMIREAIEGLREDGLPVPAPTSEGGNVEIRAA